MKQRSKGDKNPLSKFKQNGQSKENVTTEIPCRL